MFKHFVTPLGVEVMQFLSYPYTLSDGETKGITFIRIEIHSPASTSANMRIYTGVPEPAMSQGKYGDWKFRFAASIQPDYQMDLWGKPDMEHALTLLKLDEGVTEKDYYTFRLFLSAFQKRVRTRSNSAVFYGLDGVVEAELSLQRHTCASIGVKEVEIKNPSLYVPIVPADPVDARLYFPEREPAHRKDESGMRITSQRIDSWICLFFLTFDEMDKTCHYGGSRAVYDNAKGYFGVYFPDVDFKPHEGAYKGLMVLGSEMDTASLVSNVGGVTVECPSYIGVLLNQLREAKLLTAADFDWWVSYLETQGVWKQVPTVGFPN